MIARKRSPNQNNIDIPVYGTIIERESLHRILDDSRHHLVTLVSAPPGYGKTTTLAHFMRSSDLPAAWHSLQERERDLSALHRHSLQSLEFVAPGISVNEGHFATPDECAAYIADYLHEHVKGHMFYVIDDLQFIAASPQAERWLRELVRQVPPTCHMVLISRALPNLPLAELIAKGDVLAIGQDQLKFTATDAASLAHKLGVSLSDHLLEERIHQLEGWPVGVAISLNPLPADLQLGLLRSGGGPESLFDTLATRTLETLPPALRDFLLTASVVSQITPQICRDILNLPNSRVVIPEIMRRNLFASQVSGGLVLHRLFRNFLQQYLKRSDPERFCELHMRAGDWHRDQHHDDEAFQHYLAADNINLALSVVEFTHRAYFKQGNEETLLRWRFTLDRYGERLPEFIYTCAMILTNRYHYNDAITELNCAEDGFATQGDESWVAEVRLQRAMIYIWLGDYQLALDLALPILHDDSLKVTTVGRAKHLLALIEMRTGSLHQAITSLEELIPVFERVNELYYASNILQDLQVAYTQVGDMHASSRCLQRLVSIRRTFGKSSELALALNNLGDHYHQIGDYELALRTLHEGLQIIEQSSNRRVESYLCWTMGDLQRDLGNEHLAQDFYERAYELSSGNEPALQQSITLSMATFYRRRGEYQLALRLIHDVIRIARADGNVQSVVSPTIRATQTALQSIIQHEPDAIDTLNAILKEMDDDSLTADHVQIALLTAQVALKYDNTTSIQNYLSICKDAFARNIGHNIIGSEIINAPELLALLEENTHFNMLADAVHYLQRARQSLSQDVGLDFDVATPTYNLRVLTLGDEAIERDGILISTSEWRSNRSKEFFLYLLFNGPTRREEISLAFWPDHSASRVRSNFHTTLYRARNALGDNVILYEDEVYRINPGVSVWCDAQRFSEYVQQAQILGYADVRADDLYSKALSYYNGDFLPTMDTEWADSMRHALHEQYIHALIGSAHCARTRQDYSVALDLLNQALTIDPYREDAYRAIFFCYAGMGERHLLLKQYRKMTRVFKSELGIPPSPETYTCVQQLTQLSS